MYAAFAPNFCGKKLAVSSRESTVPRFLFTMEFLTNKQHDCAPVPTLFTWPTHLWLICFPYWRCAILQVVLSILTEHYFQDAFKDGRNAGNGAYTWKGTISWVMFTFGPNIPFWCVAVSACECTMFPSSGTSCLLQYLPMQEVNLTLCQLLCVKFSHIWTYLLGD